MKQENHQDIYTENVKEKIDGENIVSSRALGWVGKIAQDSGEHLQYMIDRPIHADATTWELEQQMRIDTLAVHLLSDEGAEPEMDLIVKFSKYAHATIEPQSGEFRINPMAHQAAAYTKAKAFAMEATRTGSVFVAEAVDGSHRVFIKSDLYGFQSALALLGYSLRYDVRSQTDQIGLPDGTWVDMDDRRESALKTAIRMGFSFARPTAKGLQPMPAVFIGTDWKEFRESHCNRFKVDSFLEWLGRLPPWDGLNRLDSWLIDAGLEFGEVAEPLLAWACRSIPLVACLRSIQPGMKHDVMPVLIGGQGLGKSTALSHLIPDAERTRWFSDELRLSDDSKARVEAIQGAVIVEVAEMTGATTADIESLKAFLSRSVDHVRLAYRRNPEPMPRRCSIAGTANRSMLPNDPTGNRRFAALDITGGSAAKVRRYLDDERVQIWAQAQKMARAGAEAWLSEELALAQTEANEAARSGDSMLENMVAEWIEKSRAASSKKAFRLSEAAAGCGMVDTEDRAAQLPVGEGRRLARALQHAGCVQKRVYEDGSQKRVWMLPDPHLGAIV